MNSKEDNTHSKLAIAVIYIHPIPAEEKHIAQTKRFVQSYRDFPAQQDHVLYVMCNGGPPTAETRALFSGIPCEFREHDDSGWDIGAFQRAAREIECDMMVFLGGHAYFRRAGWLKRMAEVFDPRHLFGSTAGHEHDSHIRTTGFWCAPALVRSYPRIVRTYRERIEFEYGKDSLTRWTQQRGGECLMVTWSGCRPMAEWRDELQWNIYRRGDQSDCLVFDRVTDNYEQCEGPERFCQEALADGWLEWRDGHAVYPRPRRQKTVPLAETSSRGPRLRVAVLSLDAKATACGFLRSAGPLEFLHARHQLEYLSVWDAGETAKLDTEQLKEANIVVVQRGMAAHLPYSVLRKAIPDRSVKIVFELDDALTLLSPSHEGFRYYQSVLPQIEEYLRKADLVTVSTPKLKEIYSWWNDRIEVLPNSLDSETWLPWVEKRRVRDKVSILFSGTLTHQHDLTVIEQAMQRILREYPERVEFVFWGDVPGRFKGHPQVRTLCGFTPDYFGYARRLRALAVDFAVVPLELTAFNRAKSPIKWLEYSACKIPALFTNIEAYNGAVEHGKTGWLVPNTSEAWYEAIKQFILSPDLRSRLAEQAHKAVLSHHTLEVNAQRWLDTYQKVLAAPPVTVKEKSPQVSIIIPVLNNLALTRQCIDAILANTPQGLYEVLVVDNASTDGTRGFLQQEEKAGRLRAIFNTSNRGFAHACNQAAQQAKCRRLLFLNNDTVVQSGWLGAMFDAAAKPGIGVVGARLLYADGKIQHAGIEFINGVPDHPHRCAAADLPEVNRFRELDMVTGACLLIRSELFLQLGGFDEIYKNGVEDVDLCLRARTAGWKVVYEPKAVVYHLEGQSAGRFDHVRENLQIFFERWGKRFDDQMRLRTPVKPQVIRAGRSVLWSGEITTSPTACRVSWEGSFLDLGSLSHVNRELTRHLEKVTGIRLSRVNSTAPASVPAYAEVQELSRSLSSRTPHDADVVVRHSWPPDWRRPRQGKLVVIQPWEYGALPVDWVQASRQVDEFWVPSEYVRKVFVESGVPSAKVRVIPNGVDPERFRPEATPLALATRKTFKFLFVGGTIHRKGADVLLRAYLKTFTAADDVCLVIKDFGNQSVYAGQTLEEHIRAAQRDPRAPEILYLTDELAPEDLPRLYAACDCLVHPYRGEGFGLPILEAMACAKPVIVTAGGAADDFATADIVYPIPARKQSIGDKVGGLKLARQGWLLEPDAAALAERMKWVMAHADEARTKGEAASKYVREHWTWGKAAELAQRRLLELQAEKGPAPAKNQKNSNHSKAKGIILPPCALVAHLGKAREFLANKNPRQAWEETLAALQRRPFNPEAYLFLAELAQTVGDSVSAKKCAEHARRLAPGWKAPKQFLNRRLNGNARPMWLTLPEAVERQAPAGQRLTVCLITKNEEQFLDQCLKSVRGLAQQIVVVDTGSTDQTVEIARRHGAEIHHFSWCDDFSAARNFALEHAAGDWVLALDADEELSPRGRELLQDHFNRSEVMAWRLPILDVGREAQGRSYVPRLFRNAPALFYVGRVHEQVFSSIEARRQEWGLENILGESELIHHGYTAELTRSRNKIDRNLHLLELAVEELPREPHLLMHLGLELARSGREIEALERYREAFAAMVSKPVSEIVPELRETLVSQFCTRLAATKEFGEIVRILQLPAARTHGALNASLSFALALAQMEIGRPELALEPLKQCLAKRNQPSLSPINSDILTAAPYHCLALCHMRLGQSAQADQAFQQALKETGSLHIVRHDYARFLAEQNRPVEALHRLHEAVAHDGHDTTAWRLGGQIALSHPQFLEFALDWTCEAMRHVSQDKTVMAQRAEALLLSQEVQASQEIWARLCVGRRDPACLAGLILCELLVGASSQASLSEPEVAPVTRAFLQWYRKCLVAGAKDLVLRLNTHTEELAGVLPEAARIIRAANAEAEQAAQAETCAA